MESFKQPVRDPEVLDRMQMAFELCDAAEQIMRQNIRRRHPELSEEEVDKRLFEWLQTRPEDEHSYCRPTERFALRP